MTTIKAQSGKKAVNIRNNGQEVSAMYVQIFNEGDLIREQVLESKTFKTEKSAINWANKILN